MASASGSIYLAHREVWEKKIADHMKGVDPNWTAVDKFTTNYLSQEHEIVGRVINQIADAGLPPIACSPVQAKLLALAAYANLAAYALEIGTLGGLTAIRLAISNPRLRITSIELHEVYANIARQNIKDAGVEDRVEVLVGPALEVLSDLAVEIEEGKREKFGLTFIDADWVCSFPDLDMHAHNTKSILTGKQLELSQQSHSFERTSCFHLP